MKLKEFTASEVDAFFTFVVPRHAQGSTPENYFPADPDNLDAEGVITIVAYVCAKKIEACGKDLPKSMLLTGFLMGREFEAWRKEMDELGNLEKLFSDGEGSDQERAP